MGRRSRTLPDSLAVHLAVASFALFAFGSARASGVVVVSGEVTTDSAAPVPNAVVSAQTLSGLPQTALTDALGKYSLSLAPGCYSMRATSDSMGTIYHPGTPFADDQEMVEVIDGQSLTRNFKYPAGFTMAGTVSATGALPSAYSVTLLGNWGEPSTITKTFTTATWSFGYVPGGDYFAQFTDLSSPTKYSKQFYNGVYAAGAATLIHLNANKTGINFNVEDAVHLTGHVNRPDNSFGLGDRVVVYTRGGAESAIVGNTNASGDFDISNPQLLPGRQFQIVGFGKTSNLWWTSLGNKYESYPSAWHVATPGTNAGLNIDALPPGSISGQVLDSITHDSIANVLIRTQDPLFTVRLGFSTFTGTSDASGNFTIPGIQPNRRYGLSAQPQNTVSNYYLSGTRNFGDLGPGATTGWDVLLQKGGKIGGHVTAASGGADVQSASVYVYSSDCVTFRGFGFTDAMGKFLTAPLEAGGYKVQYVAPGNSGLGDIWYMNKASCDLGATVNVTAGNTTNADAAIPNAAAAGGHKATGKFTNSENGFAIQGFIQYELKSDLRVFADFSDPCGRYEVTGMPDGTYNAYVSVTGFASQIVLDALTISGGDVIKNFALDPLKGAITGKVMSAALPVQGATVCTQNNNCALTDSSGRYWIPYLGTGTYNLISYVPDGLEPAFKNGVSVTNGATTSVPDISQLAVADDPDEDDALTTPTPLFRPERDAGPPRLLPDAPQNRAFQDTEDTDWFRFTATSGKVYRLTITGGGFSRYGGYVGIFDGVTHAPDTTATAQILLAAGWTVPSSGERWIGLSSAFSGSYTVTLTESNPGPPPPTVSSINPTSGPAAGGTTVTITGTNFVVGATVKFGAASATNVVVGAGGTTITCKSPAVAAGTLVDLVVTNPSTQSATLTKGWFADFTDVPQAYLYHSAIEKIVRAGITTGCGGGKFCPGDAVTRDALAKFLLVAKNGPAFNPPAATGNVFCDVATGTLLAKWIEEFFNESFTNGCSAGGCGKPNYCPTGVVTRDAMAKFLLLAKNGSSFNPPAATGSVFCDVTAGTLLAKWIEEMKAENITGGCDNGACGKPDYCPTGIVSRGEMAKFLRVAFNL